MRRRPSGSATDEDDDADPKPEHPYPTTEAPVKHALSVEDLIRRPSVDSTRRKSHDSRAAEDPSMSKRWDRLSPADVYPSDQEASTKVISLSKDVAPDTMVEMPAKRRSRLRSPWACSGVILTTTALALLTLFAILQSFFTRQLDPKGCAMSYMRPAFAKFSDFDTEHTRFASKYSLYLYREGGIDEDTRVKGIPVLFIPGNAGSYKQVRPIAAEAATFYHDVLQHDPAAVAVGKRTLDFFSVDFNEDITAFHGQTLLDQAEYLNEAVSFILSLYHKPHRSVRDPDLPDPTSVIIIGHSMGGIVARTMLTMPNYQSNTINTIVTLSAPHARPPVSFDSDIVSTYKSINDYWRHSYSQKWANNNPLWHVTLISIAGGGLDTIVPSDYASISSLVPPTHGFTVFTSSIPNVWTGMDHLAIMWCDQFRKSLIRALYEIVDVNRPSQTRSRAERMKSFKKWLLTGMEDVAEKTLPHSDPRTLLTLEDSSNAIISQGERLTLRMLGLTKRPKAYLLPVPPQGSLEGKRFTLLSNQRLDGVGENGNLEVLFCSIYPSQAGQSGALFAMNLDLAGEGSISQRLACKNAAADTIALPASTRESKYPFESRQPFSYLQYDLKDLAEHQFVAVVDKATYPTQGWVIAEFAESSESTVRKNIGLQRLLSRGVSVKLQARRSLVTDIKIPALHSSLLAYKLTVGQAACAEETELFTPLLRQYVSEPYESKYFVNVKEADINLHGVAPYLPPALRGKSDRNGLSLQLWTDPTCNSSMEVKLKVDLVGSLGKLYMRYRTVFAAFPLLVVALVIRKQFKVYDETGVFMSFSEGMDQCLRTSFPVLLIALTFFTISLAGSSQAPPKPKSHDWFNWNSNATESQIDYTVNDLLLGSQDTFFWFLVPLFGLISVGIAITVNYTALALTELLAFVYSHLSSATLRSEDGRRTPATFAVTSPRKRIITTGVLLFLVSTVIPYQFAYMVLCIVQLATCTRAMRLARESKSGANYNFYNYAHSLFVLMVWILPINLPILVVWVHNLAVHWLTPFSSHHNILSIMPFILLVETLSTGQMIPRIKTRIRYFTNLLLFALALYAAIYGVTYAYILHHLVNMLCGWLVVIHLSNSSFSFSQLLEDPEEASSGQFKKRP